MAVASKMVIFTLLFLLILIIGGVFLQIFLSRRKSRWPGLVLPFLSFLFAFLMLFNLRDTGSVSGNLLVILTTLLAGNLPTLVLLAIYWAAREKFRVQRQMDKMNIDDL